MLYQVMAQNWITTNISANTFFLHQKAEQSVRTKAMIMTTVATIRVLANILVSCLTGPMRNNVLTTNKTLQSNHHVPTYLPRAVKFPRV